MERDSGPLNTRDYLDFDLEIRGGDRREYSIAVRSPAGEAQEQMSFPFDDRALRDRLRDLEVALLRSGGTRRSLSREEQTVQDFGRSLFEALLVGDVRTRYLMSLDKAEQQDKGLRLKLRVQPPELAVLPWEFLYDPDRDYLCFSPDTPIVRYVDLRYPVKQLTVTPPLRILGMVASPRGLDPLDVEKEKELLNEAIAELRDDGLVELTWLEGQTWRDLRRAMRRGGPWHVFHFVGHGDFDVAREEGAIALTDEETGREHLLRSRDLARLLDGHRYLRLVFLNSCEGARGSEGDPFSGTAATLVRNRIPAVVAMQYQITDKAAIEFSRSFYEAVADGWPVDAAVADARVAVSMDSMLEWGTPVLYMRSPDGRLFDISTDAQPVKSTSEQTGDREEDLLRRYRKSVEWAWADGNLHEHEVERLKELANRFRLTPSAAADIEREVMGGTVEAILERQEQAAREERAEEERRNRLESARQEQAAREELTRRVAAKYDQGLRHIEAQEWQQALECFEEVQRLEPGYREIERLLSQVQREVTGRTGVRTVNGSRYIGIDFGTTNSSMAWCDPDTGRAEVILNEEGEEKTPSVVYFGEDEIIVGKCAEEKLEEVEDSTDLEERNDVSQRIVRSIKRNLLDPPVIPLPGREPVRPVEVVAHILGKLKHDAEEEHFQEEVERVVVTCPATFDTQQREVLLDGAAMAGFRRVELLEEPTAVALAFTKQERKLSKGLLIYDLGAGTFDLSVVVRDSEDNPFYVLMEPQGDLHFGTDDLDLALYDYCDGIALEELGRHISLTEDVIDLPFLRQCRSRRRMLSKVFRTTFSSFLPSESGQQRFRHTVDRKTFEDLIRPQIEGTVKMTAELWDQVKDQVDAVILIGDGGTIPLVRRRLEEALEVKPRSFAEKDRAVALGAAYHTYELWIEKMYANAMEPSSEIKEYRRALESCWNDRWLSRHEVEWLATLASRELQLDPEDAARVERQVMGDTIEAILERQEQAAREKDLDELYAQARRSHQEQNWQAVVDAFDQIHTIDPEFPDPEGVLVSAREALEAQELAAQNTTQAAQQIAQELGVDLSQVQGSGAEGRITVRDVIAASNQ